jgi:hypothetical protein
MATTEEIRSLSDDRYRVVCIDPIRGEVKAEFVGDFVRVSDRDAFFEVLTSTQRVTVEIPVENILEVWETTRPMHVPIEVSEVRVL